MVPGTLADSLAEARQNCNILRWPLPPALVFEAKVAYRNRLATTLAQSNPPDIVTSVVYLTMPQMQRMVNLALKALSWGPLTGVGIELGAGCGLLASVVAMEPRVQAVFAVEVCEQTALLLIPKVASWVLGSDAVKVIPVVGTFDDLRLPDRSLDFAIEIDSLHHSDDLTTTLRECARVLKPGGRMMCFDRCHPDSVADQQVDEMLSEVYSREFLIANHYPPDIVLTRRENGEHEYRLFEWKAAFEAAGLTLIKRVRFETAVSARAAAKGVLSVLPQTLRRWLYRSDGPTLATSCLWLVQQVQAARGYPNRRWPVLAPKTTTLFALAKR